jgi:hypothetical protein
MGEGKTAPRGKRRSKAFYLAMASVAADGGAAGIPVQWPYGFPHASCRKPAFHLEHRSATFLIESSRPAPLTRPGGFGCNARRVVRLR